MPKFIDKMNLPQYRYFHDIAAKEEERREIVSDALAGEHTMRGTNKRDRIDGMMMFNRAVRRIPESIAMMCGIPMSWTGAWQKSSLMCWSIIEEPFSAGSHFCWLSGKVASRRLQGQRWP